MDAITHAATRPEIRQASADAFATIVQAKAYLARGCTTLEHATREQWLAARMAGIGGSEAAAIMGASPWASPMSVYADKLGVSEPIEETDPMRWGKRLEGPAADAYMEETGRTVTNLGQYTILTSRERPFVFATIDRLILPCHDANCFPAPAEGPGVLEIKTARFGALDDWEGEPPVNYQIQVQHQMMVTGCSWGSFAVLFGGQTFRWFDFTRSGEFIATLLAVETDFWRRVTEKDPPPPDASEATKAALLALYPRQTIASVALPAEAAQWDEELEGVKEEIAAATALKLELENKLKAALGAAERGILPDGTAYTWREQQKKAYAVAASSSRVLRRMSRKGDD